MIAAASWLLYKRFVVTRVRVYAAVSITMMMMMVIVITCVSYVRFFMDDHHGPVSRQWSVNLQRVFPLPVYAPIIYI